jgi:hypothetical protein
MFARGKKSAGFGLLQEYVTARACEPDSANIQLIVSANLYKQLSKITIGSTDQEDLRSGLSPFLMCPVSYHKAAAQRELNAQYSLISEGVRVRVRTILWPVSSIHGVYAVELPAHHLMNNSYL